MGLASSLTLLAAIGGAWMGLGPAADKDLSAMGMNSQASGLARQDSSERGSRSGPRKSTHSTGPKQKSVSAPGPSAELPPVPEQGSGKTRTAFGGSSRFGKGPLIRYRVEIERELPFAPGEVAMVIDETLRDPRSWAANGHARFQRVDDGSADLLIIVATPATTDELCYPLDTAGEVSCRNGATVALNAERWANGVEAYGNDVADYRRYLVNHEVGHFLGHGHTDCSSEGRRAPVMMQQTKGVDGCRANPWPLSSEF